MTDRSERAVQSERDTRAPVFTGVFTSRNGLGVGLASHPMSIKHASGGPSNVGVRSPEELESAGCEDPCVLQPVIAEMVRPLQGWGARRRRTGGEGVAHGTLSQLPLSWGSGGTRMAYGGVEGPVTQSNEVRTPIKMMDPAIRPDRLLPQMEWSWSMSDAGTHGVKHASDRP